MSQNETDQPEALTAILALVVFIAAIGGAYTSCDKHKSSAEVDVQQAPPVTPTPTPSPLPTPTPAPGGTLQNTWITLNSVSPPAARAGHAAVWTGSRMIIWGGRDAAGARGDGAALDPVTGTWNAIATSGAPSARFGHAAAWNGSRMIIWGGTNGSQFFNDGFAYNPVTNSWSPLTNEETPLAGRAGHSFVYTGQYFLMWSGYSASNPSGYIDGGYYSLNVAWSPLTGTAPVLARIGHSAVWTGAQMIMFGGQNQGVTSQDGYIFDPNTNIFTQMPVTLNTPSPRSSHAAVWTGYQMLVWGGQLQGITTSYMSDGRIYDYATNSWGLMSPTSAPAARAGHSAVWAGDAMIIWGGTSGPATYYNSGAVFH